MPKTISATASAEWRAHWTVFLAAAAGVSLSAVSVSSLDVMMEPLEQEFDWTWRQISLGTSLASFMAFFLAIAALFYLSLGRHPNFTKQEQEA